MKPKLLAAVAATALFAAAGPASAQVYYSGGTYVYPASGTYYYPSTTSYYYPTTGAHISDATYYTPTYGTTYYTPTYRYSPYFGSTTYYRSGPYLDVSPWGVNNGVGSVYNRGFGWGRGGRWWR